MSTNLFQESQTQFAKLIAAAKKIGKGADPEEAGFEGAYLMAYGAIARRCRDNRELGLSRYPYEAPAGVNPYQGWYFKHKEWPVRRAMEARASLRGIAEHEANYVNAAGYWLVFTSTAYVLRDEETAKPNGAGNEAAKRYDVWGLKGQHYALRALGLRTEYYKLAAEDPGHAKLLMPALEKHASAGDTSATDTVDEALSKFDAHLATALMQAAASVSAKKSGAGGADN